MMKPPKERTKSFDVNEHDEEELAALLPQPTCYFDKLASDEIADLMIKHEKFPPTTKNNPNPTIEWQKEELILRTEYCRAKNIPIIFANELTHIGGKYAINIDIASTMIKTALPKSEFIITFSNAERCTIQGRRNHNAPWVECTFDIIDAEEFGLLSKNNKHWKGDHNIQNMLAKSAFMKIFRIVGRDVLGSLFIPEETPDTDSKTIALEDKTQIVSFSKLKEDATPKPAFTQPITIIQEETQIEEPIVQEVFEVVELEADSAMELESNEKEIEATIKTDMPSAEELKAIRDQKISELPPTADAPLEIIDEPINILEHEEILLTEPEKPESKRKQKKTTKAVIKEEKPDTSFLDKPPLKETPIEPLRKPFPMTELAVTDPKYHTKEIYDMIGDDWFMAFKKEDMQSNLWLDANFTIYQSIVQKYDESLIPKVIQKYEEFYQQANPSEKLIVLYRDALIGMENPPPMNILDTKYLEKMVFIVGLLKTFKPSKTDPDSKREEFFQWFTEKNQGNNKEALWGYKYMQARGLI